MQLCWVLMQCRESNTIPPPYLKFVKRSAVIISLLKLQIGCNLYGQTCPPTLRATALRAAAKTTENNKLCKYVLLLKNIFLWHLRFYRSKRENKSNITSLLIIVKCQELAFFIQRIGLAIQLRNAASIFIYYIFSLVKITFISV